MKIKILKIALYLFILNGLYNLWTLRPVKIIYAYSDAGGVVMLVVDHLPWTDRDKINWYLSRQQEIKYKYPLTDDYHTYYIAGIDDGFTNYQYSPHEDIFCFPTIQSEKNCIVKDYLLIIDEQPYRNTRYYITATEGEYELTPENKLERIYHEYLPE
ncbi:DUF943 family protein [Enterobacter sp. E76]|nr:DUF943 family protein [Enterobacter sp. E76]